MTKEPEPALSSETYSQEVLARLLSPRIQASFEGRQFVSSTMPSIPNPHRLVSYKTVHKSDLEQNRPSCSTRSSPPSRNTAPSIPLAPAPPLSGYTFFHPECHSRPQPQSQLQPQLQLQLQPQPQPQPHSNSTSQPPTKLDNQLPPRYLGYHLTPHSQTPHDITFQYLSSPSSSPSSSRSPFLCPSSSSSSFSSAPLETPHGEGILVHGETVKVFQERLRGVKGVEGWLKGWIGRSLARARGR